MSSWNYRVVRTEDGLRIFDVYYDDNGVPIATHVSPTYVYGDTIEEMKEQMDWMLSAFTRPILDESEIGSPVNAVAVTGEQQ